MSEHTVTQATSRSTSGGRRQDRVLRDDLGFPIRYDDPFWQSYFATIDEQGEATQEDDVLPSDSGGPMSSCLYCLRGVPELDSQLGKRGDPVGLCTKCNCMSCGWHGARTVPSFICIVCDVDNLLASAGWPDFKARGGVESLLPGRGALAAPGARGGPTAGVSDADAAADLARVLAALFSTADGAPSLLVVATLQQWFDERPYYQRFRKALDDGAVWAMQVFDRYFQTTAKSGTGARPGVPGHYGEGAIRSLWMRLDPTGHEAPRRQRRHRQHTAIMTRSGPGCPWMARTTGQARRPPGWTPGLILGHPGTGHGAGRRTGSTPTADNAGP